MKILRANSLFLLLASVGLSSCSLFSDTPSKDALKDMQKADNESLTEPTKIEPVSLQTTLSDTETGALPPASSSTFIRPGFREPDVTEMLPLNMDGSSIKTQAQKEAAETPEIPDIPSLTPSSRASAPPPNPPPAQGDQYLPKQEEKPSSSSLKKDKSPTANNASQAC